MPQIWSDFLWNWLTHLTQMQWHSFGTHYRLTCKKKSSNWSMYLLFNQHCNLANFLVCAQKNSKNSSNHGNERILSFFIHQCKLVVSIKKWVISGAISTCKCNVVNKYRLIIVIGIIYGYLLLLDSKFIQNDPYWKNKSSNHKSVN